MEKEIWKDIPGYEGFYQVSNFSRVRSLTRVVKCRNGYKTHNGKVMKAIINGSGYVQYCLSKKGKQKIFLSHRLVADAFIPNPENKPQINHIDNNPSNDSISNLEWTTQSENIIHAIKQGRKTSKSVMIKIIDTSNGIVFESLKDASKYCGFSKSHLCSMLKGKYPNKTNLKYYYK